MTSSCDSRTTAAINTSAATGLSGKTAAVTGASRGIGAEIARLLAASGVRVALLARTVTALEAVVSEIDKDAIAIRCDVSDEDSVTAAANEARAAFGRAPDILVNNAGAFHLGSLHEMQVGQFAESLQTNLVAPFLMTRAFLAEMRMRNSGHIVTVGSVADRSIFPDNGAYAASKYGLRAMHEVLRAEVRGTGVRATLVSPSAVDTNLWDPMDTEGADSPFPSRGSMLSTNAVAHAVLYALSQPPEVNVDELRLSRS